MNEIRAPRPALLRSGVALALLVALAACGPSLSSGTRSTAAPLTLSRFQSGGASSQQNGTGGDTAAVPSDAITQNLDPVLSGLTPSQLAQLQQLESSLGGSGH